MPATDKMTATRANSSATGMSSSAESPARCERYSNGEIASATSDAIARMNPYFTIAVPFLCSRRRPSFQRDVMLPKNRRGGELERGDRLAEIRFGASLLAARGDHGALPLLDQEQRRSSGAKLALLAVVLFFRGFPGHARGGQPHPRRLKLLHRIADIGLDRLLDLLGLILDPSPFQERAAQVRFGGAVANRDRDAELDLRGRKISCPEVAQ